MEFTLERTETHSAKADIYFSNMFSRKNKLVDKATGFANNDLRGNN